MGERTDNFFSSLAVAFDDFDLDVEADDILAASKWVTLGDVSNQPVDGENGDSTVLLDPSRLMSNSILVGVGGKTGLNSRGPALHPEEVEACAILDKLRALCAVAPRLASDELNSLPVKILARPGRQIRVHGI